MSRDWKALSKRVVSHVGLRSKPLGFKLVQDASTLTDIKGLGRPKFKRTVCQFIGSARWVGKAWGATAEDQLCQPGAWCMGVFPEASEAFASGQSYLCTGLNIAQAKSARTIVSGLPKIQEKFEAFAVMPLDGGVAADEITFEPDLVIIYGEPGQIAALVLPTCAALGIPALQGRILGDTGLCGDGISACWNTREPKFFLPCVGDRAFGGTLPSEVSLVYPSDDFNEEVVANIEKLNFPSNLLLEGSLGSCAQVTRMLGAMAASTFPLTKGTPLVPEEKS